MRNLLARPEQDLAWVGYPRERPEWPTWSYLRRRHYVRNRLELQGYQIPSAARWVRLCPCGYPLTFFDQHPPADHPAGEVTCPACEQVQLVGPGGKLPHLTIYELPDYADRYVVRRGRGGDARS